MDYCRYLLDCLTGHYRSEAGASIYSGLLLGSTFAFALWDRIDTGDLRFLFPFLMVAAMWSLDLITGLWCAWERRDFCPNKLARSFRKLLLYALVMALGMCMDAFGARYPVFGLNVLAPFYWLINCAIVLTEASSVLRNAGDLSDSPALKKILRRFADRADDKLAQIIATQEELKEKVDVAAQAATVAAVGARSATAGNLRAILASRQDSAAESAGLSSQVEANTELTHQAVDQAAAAYSEAKKGDPTP